MWISKKRFRQLEKRVADLEEQVQSQHETLANMFVERRKLLTKSSPPHQWKQ